MSKSPSLVRSGPLQQDRNGQGVCGFEARIIHEVPNLSLSIPKRTTKKVSSSAMKTWPPSVSNE